MEMAMHWTRDLNTMWKTIPESYLHKWVIMRLASTAPHTRVISYYLRLFRVRSEHTRCIPQCSIHTYTAEACWPAYRQQGAPRIIPRCLDYPAVKVVSQLCLTEIWCKCYFFHCRSVISCQQGWIVLLSCFTLFSHYPDITSLCVVLSNSISSLLAIAVL